MAKRLEVFEERPPVTLSRKQALAQVDEAQKLFNSVRPVKDDIGACPSIGDKGEDLFLSSCVMALFGLIIGLVNLDIGVPFLYSLSGIVMTVSICGVVLFPAVVSPKYFRNSNRKINKMLSYVFLDKAQRDWIREYQKNIALHQQATEVYKLLVARGIKELEDKGVFEVINDISNPDNHQLTYINETTGEIEYIDRSVYEEDRRKELVTNPALVSKVILGKLADKKELFG